MRLKDGCEGRVYFLEKTDRRLTNWFALEAAKSEVWFDVRHLMPLIGMRAPVGIEEVTHRVSLKVLAEEFLPFVEWLDVAGCGHLHL